MLNQIIEITRVALIFKRNEEIKNQILVRVLLLRCYHNLYIVYIVWISIAIDSSTWESGNLKNVNNCLDFQALVLKDI